MESNIRFIQRLFGWLLILLCCVSIYFGFFSLVKTELSGMSITMWAMMLWFGFGFLALAMMNLKTLEINEEQIIIGTCLGLVKRHYQFDDLVAVNPKSFRNRYRTYPGLILKFRDGYLLYIHEMEFRNFREFKKIIIGRINKDRELQIPVWTPFAKTFVAIGGLILSMLLVVKLSGL